jgi:hypothetical protein
MPANDRYQRDTPCVRADGCDPMNPFDMYQRPIVDPYTLLPVYSQYVGDQYLDRAMPLIKVRRQLALVLQCTPAPSNAL